MGREYVTGNEFELFRIRDWVAMLLGKENQSELGVVRMTTLGEVMPEGLAEEDRSTACIAVGVSQNGWELIKGYLPGHHHKIIFFDVVKEGDRQHAPEAPHAETVPTYLGRP